MALGAGSASSRARKWLARSVQILKNIFRRYIQNSMSQKISMIAKP